MPQERDEPVDKVVDEHVEQIQNQLAEHKIREVSFSRISMSRYYWHQCWGENVRIRVSDHEGDYPHGLVTIDLVIDSGMTKADVRNRTDRVIDLYEEEARRVWRETMGYDDDEFDDLCHC